MNGGSLESSNNSTYVTGARPAADFPRCAALRGSRVALRRPAADANLFQGFGVRSQLGLAGGELIHLEQVSHDIHRGSIAQTARIVGGHSSADPGKQVRRREAVPVGQERTTGQLRDVVTAIQRRPMTLGAMSIVLGFATRALRRC